MEGSPYIERAEETDARESWPFYLIVAAAAASLLFGASVGGSFQLAALQAEKGYWLAGLVFGSTFVGAVLGVGAHHKLGTSRAWSWIVAGFLGGVVPLPLLLRYDTIRVGLMIGTGAGFLLFLISLSGRALGDARRLAVERKAHNLAQDAWIEHALNEGGKAEALLVEAVKLCQKKLGQRNLLTLMNLHSLANLYRLTARYEQAQELYEAALPLYDELVKRNKNARALCLYDLALNHYGQEQFQQTVESCQGAIEHRRKHQVDELEDQSNCFALMGRGYVKMNDDEKAVGAFLKALDLRQKALGPRHPQVMNLLGALSRCYMRLNRFQETEGYLKNLVETLGQAEDPNFELMVEAMLDLGLVRVRQGRAEQARPLLTKALRYLQEQVGPDERLLHKTVTGFQKLLGKGKGEIDLLVIFRGEREQLRRMVEEAPGWVQSRDGTGWGPLQWAIFIGREDLTGWLLRKGATPDFDSESALGPLHVAAAWGRRQSVLDLLNAGVNVDARGPGGWTPLYWACHFGRDRIVDLLVKKKAQVNLRDDEGRSPLHVAAAAGEAGCALHLLSQQAKVNAKEKSGGRSPLHEAAFHNRMKMVEVLMLNGADVLLQDKEGKAPMDRAASRLLVRFMKKFLSGRGKWEGAPEP